ncbi:MAG: sialidase family protein [Actinomycetota bacterium]
MRFLRVALVSLLALTASLALAPPAGAVPAWGPQRTIDTWSWSQGSTLARSAGGGLVALVGSDFSQGAFATDHGPFMGVFVRTSDDRGSSWSPAIRVSQAKRHADRGALAVSGGASYAAWVTQLSYDHYDPSKPRVLSFRSSTGSGWGKTVALTKQKGRVDAPSVAAAGKHVYVAWTDANTGQVRVARSSNGGRTFVKSVVGRTTAVSSSDEGLFGYPSVGATGNVVGVAWIASGSGALKARVSTNGGKTWHHATSVVGSLAFANGGTPSVRGWQGKLALAWTTPSGVFARVWSSSWGATRNVASFGGGGAYKGGYDVQIAPFQGQRMGIVWSACRTACDAIAGDSRVDVLWSESADGGGSWSDPSLVQGSVHAEQQVNEGPSAVWLDAGSMAVAFTSRATGWTSYETLLRVGS